MGKNPFFENLAIYFKKENHLSNFLVALLNSSESLKENFLKYLGIPIGDKSISIQREFLIKEGRPDIAILLDGVKSVLIEVKLFSLTKCHVQQYEGSSKSWQKIFLLHAKSEDNIELKDEDEDFLIQKQKIIRKRDNKILQRWNVLTWDKMFDFLTKDTFVDSPVDITQELDKINCENFVLMAKLVLNRKKGIIEFWNTFNPIFNQTVDEKLKIDERKERSGCSAFPKMWVVSDDIFQLNYRIRIKPKSHPFQIKIGLKLNPKKIKKNIMDMIVEVMNEDYKRYFPDDQNFRRKKNSETKYDFTRIISNHSFNDVLTNIDEIERLAKQIAEILSTIENKMKSKMITKIKQL
ncbi:hypothetical protein NEF87_000219 [Candidatus Lokiarchaeum ossiferum]|uniref:PD-(D/E)XK nuclease superfamily protein n=1 Tax=Candidatus Lokiarchaeum ossiferum TaxID=2951803 RepID=A0ABY6HN63_9ARCH|nr:hypothetical protein NEF87_000219 [Candidatus Lokiarchaeum sp. B-35]